MIETSLQHTISQINNSYDQTNGKSGYALWQPNRTQFQCNYWGWGMDREGQPLKPGAYYKSLKYIFPPFSPSQLFIHYKTTQFRSYRVLLLCNKYIMHEKSTPSLWYFLFQTISKLLALVKKTGNFILPPVKYYHICMHITTYIPILPYITCIQSNSEVLISTGHTSSYAALYGHQRKQHLGYSAVSSSIKMCVHRVVLL